MPPTEHITADLTAIGLAVASTREVATVGVWGAIDVTLTDGRRLLADYGPAGVHAWRWPEEWFDIASTSDATRCVVVAWSKVSTTTAGDALAISDALRGACTTNETTRIPTVGWYSAEQARRVGIFVYLDEDGAEVFCSQVGMPGDPAPMFADVACVSTKLARWVRSEIRHADAFAIHTQRGE